MTMTAIYYPLVAQNAANFHSTMTYSQDIVTTFHFTIGHQVKLQCAFLKFTLKFQNANQYLL